MRRSKLCFGGTKTGFALPLGRSNNAVWWRSAGRYPTCLPGATMSSFSESLPLDPNLQPLRPLAPTEWHILGCVYDLGSANPLQVSEQLRVKNLRFFSPSTCNVFLGRVAAKGYLSVESERQARGRPLHIYTPTVPWEVAMRRFFESFIEDYRVDDKGLDLIASIVESRTSAKR